MKVGKLISFASVGLLLLAGCGGPEGTWTLDKDATKAAIDAGKGEKDAKEFGKALLDAMDMSIELKSGGKYEMKSSVELEKGKKTDETESGDWTKDGDTVTLKGKKEDLKCKIESGKMSCSGKDDESAYVFKKS